MGTRSRSRTQGLTRDQLGMLVQIVREESGDTLTQTRFNDAMLILFENIAGFEALSRKQSARHLKALWEGYKGHR